MLGLSCDTVLRGKCERTCYSLSVLSYLLEPLRDFNACWQQKAPEDSTHHANQVNETLPPVQLLQAMPRRMEVSAFAHQGQSSRPPVMFGGKMLQVLVCTSVFFRKQPLHL